MSITTHKGESGGRGGEEKGDECEMEYSLTTHRVTHALSFCCDLNQVDDERL